MEVFLNGAQCNTQEDTNLGSFLSEYSLPEKGIAIALNEEVIPKTNWNTTYLKSNDKIIIIKATQGG